VRYGILGFGHHAEKRLMPGFASALQSKAAAFWRNNESLAPDTAERFGLRSHATVDALCADPEVDIVLITSPDALHLEHAEIAFRHRKPVFCEKPMAMNAEECARMIAAADAAGVTLGVAHVMRLHQSVNVARQWIQQGRLGALLAARCDFTYPGLRSPRSWITNSRLAAGGPSADVGVHCFDTLRYVLQDEVSSVFASMVHDDRSGDVEASAHIQLDFARGCLADVFVSTRSPYRTYLEVIGTDRTIECRNALWVDGPVHLILLEEGREIERVTCDNHLSYARQLDAFSDAVATGQQPFCTGQEGLANQKIIDAAYASARSGKKLSLSA